MLTIDSTCVFASHILIAGQSEERFRSSAIVLGDRLGAIPLLPGRHAIAWSEDEDEAGASGGQRPAFLLAVHLACLGRQLGLITGHRLDLSLGRPPALTVTLQPADLAGQTARSRLQRETILAAVEAGLLDAAAGLPLRAEIPRRGRFNGTGVFADIDRVDSGPEGLLVSGWLIQGPGTGFALMTPDGTSLAPEDSLVFLERPDVLRELRRKGFSQASPMPRGFCALLPKAAPVDELLAVVTQAGAGCLVRVPVSAQDAGQGPCASLHARRTMLDPAMGRRAVIAMLSDMGPRALAPVSGRVPAAAPAPARRRSDVSLDVVILGADSDLALHALFRQRLRWPASTRVHVACVDEGLLGKWQKRLDQARLPRFLGVTVADPSDVAAMAAIDLIAGARASESIAVLRAGFWLGHVTDLRQALLQLKSGAWGALTLRGRQSDTDDLPLGQRIEAGEEPFLPRFTLKSVPDQAGRDPRPGMPEETDVLAGHQPFLLRTEVFLAAGGLGAGYRRLDWALLDLSRRLKAAGHRLGTLQLRSLTLPLAPLPAQEPAPMEWADQMVDAERYHEQAGLAPREQE